jgi:uncharacterized protein YndB with AHSA1/START domain
MQIKETAYFNCPREVLWRYIEEPDRQKLWMKGLLSNQSTSPGRTGVGSTFRMVIQEGRKPATYEGEVTAHDRPRRLEIRFWGGGFPAGMIVRVDYQLSKVGAQTRLDYTSTVEGKRLGLLMRTLFVLFKVVCRMQLRSFFRKLKALVEAPAAAA